MPKKCCVESPKAGSSASRSIHTVLVVVTLGTALLWLNDATGGELPAGTVLLIARWGSMFVLMPNAEPTSFGPPAWDVGFVQQCVPRADNPLSELKRSLRGTT